MIHIDQLYYQPNKQPTVFNNLNLSLEAGQITGLVGNNGSGKTTLLKLLSGLRFPQSGTIQVNHYEPRQRSLYFLQSVYLVTEDLYHPHITAHQFADYYGPFYPKFDKSRFLDHLRNFQVPGHTPLSSLSYGQNKKCYLAFAFATHAQLLLLDEPTNGLDIHSIQILRQLLTSHMAGNRLVIIATHHIQEAGPILDYLVIINQAHIMLSRSMSWIQQLLADSEQLNDQELTSQEQWLKTIYQQHKAYHSSDLKENHFETLIQLALNQLNEAQETSS